MSGPIFFITPVSGAFGVGFVGWVVRLRNGAVMALI